MAIYPLQGAITAIKYFGLKKNLSVSGSNFLDPISCVHHKVYTYTYSTNNCVFTNNSTNNCVFSSLYIIHTLFLYIEEGKIVIFYLAKTVQLYLLIHKMNNNIFVLV